MNVTLTLNEISVEQANKILALVKDEKRQTTAAEPQTTAPVSRSAYQQPMSSSQCNPAPTFPAPQQAAPVAPMPPQTVVPTAAPAYTIEQFQTALTPLLDAGKVAQVQQLVQSFGVSTLMDIPPQRYGEFANGLRQLGGVL